MLRTLKVTKNENIINEFLNKIIEIFFRDFYNTKKS